jgi:spore coat polysaccharide biosynthesis protein SpsF
MRVVCIIQARLTSTRFPRKVLEKINGKSMIARVCEAARNSQLVDKVVVAWAHKFPHLDENDVLGRFREVAVRENADVVVRLTSDCPLLSPWVIDDAIARFISISEGDGLYYSNRDRLQDGFDVQVLHKDLLNDEEFTDKEHVVKPPLKLSVDTPEDLERVRNYAR